MNNKNKKNEDRLGMRLNSELKSRIDYAAELKGTTTAGFVKETLIEAANKTIEEHEFIKLTRLDKEAFVQSLLNPPEPSKNSIKAARRYKKKLGL